MATEFGGWYRRVAVLKLGRFGDIPFGQQQCKSGQGWREQGGMSKGVKVGGRGSADTAVGSKGTWGWGSRHSEMPQAGGGSAMALKDRGVIVPDGCVQGGEGDIAASVTQLSNGEEGVRHKVGKNMDFSGSRREARNVKLRLMGRVHDGGVWVTNADGIVGRLLVNDW
jgi:hypothetical protein